MRARRRRRSRRTERGGARSGAVRACDTDARRDAAVRLPTQEDQPEPDSGFATPAALERAARQWAEQQEIKFGHFVGPVRAALTGTNKGPGFFDVVFLLGKDACVRRLRKQAER